MPPSISTCHNNSRAAVVAAADSSIILHYARKEKKIPLFYTLHIYTAHRRLNIASDDTFMAAFFLDDNDDSL